MAVPVGTARTRYIGNGSAGPFAFNFVLYDQTHLNVVKTDTDGVDTELMLTTHYTVSLASDFSSAAITLVTPLAGDGIDDGGSEILTITRDPPIQQLTEWPRNDNFPARTHERAADLAVMLIDRLNEKVGRSLLLPESSTLSNLRIPAPVANLALGWNSSADNLANISVPTIYTTNDEPGGAIIINSLWIDADSANLDLYQHTGSAWVDTGVNLKGIQGVPGLMPGYLFNFDSNPAMADPGTGEFRLNNTTPSLATAIAVSDLSSVFGNPDVSLAVLSWDDGSSAIRGHLVIKDITAPQNFVVYSITGASTDNSGWTQLAITAVTGAGSFVNGGTYSIEFIRAGDKGDTGDEGLVVGKQTIWVPAGAMTPRVTNGASVGLLDTGNQDNTIPVLDFDQTTVEYAQFCIAMPKSWNEGTVTFTPYWTADAGTAAQTFILQMNAAAISNDDPLNATLGGVVGSSDALIATGDLHIGPESSALTISGTPAEGDLVIFALNRDVNTDTLAADARLIGIQLHITLNANTDA